MIFQFLPKFLEDGMVIEKTKTSWFSLLLVGIVSLVLTACGGSGEGNADGQGQTLQSVIERDSVLCGVSAGLAGFSNPDSSGDWKGLDVDVCRAVAAATLGDASKVTYIPLTAKERFTALQSGEIDMLSRNTTWTITRDTSLGLNFAGINYYDGAGFLVRASTGINSMNELDGATICIQGGTTTELNLADFFLKGGMSYTPITFETSQQTLSGFESERCDVLTSDRSQLTALRTTLADPSVAKVLDGVYSKEPLGPVVRNGDEQWFKIVRWSLFAMIAGEEYEVTSQNVSDIRSSSDSPEILRMLGVEGNSGADMGIDNDWAYNIISQVGNYQESYDRNVGKNSPLGLARGVNDQWYRGGLLYAMPFR